MARGPNSIYNLCVAKARDKDRSLAGCNDEDIIRDINLKYRCPSLLENDVKRVFFENNYGIKKTDKALKQWIELRYVARIPFNGYWAILFMDYSTRLKEKTTGAE